MSLLRADVVVIGGEFAGLVAGAILAHNKHRVIVLGASELKSNSQLGEIMAPVVPNLWRMPIKGPAHELMKGLGLRQRIRKELGEPESIGLLDDPDIRMTFSADERKREKELLRVFPNEATRIADALTGVETNPRHDAYEASFFLGDDGLLSRLFGRSKKEAPAIPENTVPPAAAVRTLGESGLRAALAHILPFVQFSSEAEVDDLGGFVSLKALASGVQSGTESGEDIRAVLVDLLKEVITGHGGEVHDDVRATKLSSKGKRLSQVETDGINTYAATAFIDATMDRSAADLFDDAKKAKAYEAESKAMDATRSAASVRWLLPKGFVPRGMEKRSIVLGDELSFLLGIYRPTPVDRAKAKKMPHEDAVVVVASAPADAGQEAQVADQIRQRLTHLMPFAEDKLILEDRILGGDAQSALTHYAKGQNALGGRSAKTPYQNLYRAGRDLAPALGGEGELLAAKAIASGIETIFGRMSQNAAA